MPGSAIRFKQSSVPRQRGETARFKVVQGPDYGCVYVLTDSKAIIGRGEESDVLISDLKASRKHAEVTNVAGGWIIKDKGSANGILHNGKATREAKIVIGDTITLGETTLEFATSEAGTQMLVAPPRPASQLGGQAQAGMSQAEFKKKRIGGWFGGSGQKNAPAQATSNRKLIFIVGGIGAAFLLLGEDPPPPKKKKIDPQVKARNLASFLPDVPLGDDTIGIFKDGLREYFSGNYSRARTQFETVLQISPGHPLATMYLDNCNKSIEEEVKLRLEQGKKSFEAGKLRDSRAHFSRVVRLLFRDQTNPAFVEAKDQLEKVEKAISEAMEL